jgi:hypothetical protein
LRHSAAALNCNSLKASLCNNNRYDCARRSSRISTGIPAASRCDPLCNSSSRVWLFGTNCCTGNMWRAPYSSAKAMAYFWSPLVHLCHLYPLDTSIVSCQSTHGTRKARRSHGNCSSMTFLSSNRGSPSLQSISHPSVLLFNWQRAVPLAFTSFLALPLLVVLLITTPLLVRQGP